MLHIRLNGLPRASGNEMTQSVPVSEYVRQSRSSVEKDQHMHVCTEWVHMESCTKPGGTAGLRDYDPVPANRELGQDF